MPPTYLGHRYGIREHLSPIQNLPQALTAGLPAKLNWVQLRKQASVCRRWKYFMWTSSAGATYSSKTIQSLFAGKMVENCAIRYAFRANLSKSAIHRRCTGDPLGQIAERCQLQPATTSQVGRRDSMKTARSVKPIVLRGQADILELKQTTATRTSPNKRFNERNKSSACAKQERETTEFCVVWGTRMTTVTFTLLEPLEYWTDLDNCEFRW